ncbi:MAG: glycosyltransferase family 9 protein [Bacteroidales bacterium]|nr:glycosyltransferase family 9 protein [Bacteroidales bacterium]
MKNFLIMQPAFIGDVIFATALVEKLAQTYPDARIDFLLRKGNEIILANNPYINRIYIWNKKDKKYRNLFRNIHEIRQTRYDLVVNLQRFASSGFVTWRAKAGEKTGYKQNPFSFCYHRKFVFSTENGKHETERNQELIAHVTDDKPAKPKIYPLEDDFKVLPELKKPFITIAPASVWFTKQFPKERWVEFINRFLSKDFTVYLLGAESDLLLCDEIKNMVEGHTVENFAGKLNLLQSAALMSQAAMNFVNDSAPLHLASAMDAPVTAIFCSTVPAFGFGSLSANSKVAETHKNLSCRPCGLHGKKVCPEGHFDCAYSISLKELLF